MAFNNIPAMFFAQAQRRRDQPRYRHRRDGTWQEVGWGAGLDRVRAMVGGLVNVGLQRVELPYHFSIESGERTPSPKVKREAIERKYRNVIEGMYWAKQACRVTGRNLAAVECVVLKTIHNLGR